MYLDLFISPPLFTRPKQNEEPRLVLKHKANFPKALVAIGVHAEPQQNSQAGPENETIGLKDPTLLFTN